MGQIFQCMPKIPEDDKDKPPSDQPPQSHYNPSESHENPMEVHSISFQDNYVEPF